MPTIYARRPALRRPKRNRRYIPSKTSVALVAGSASFVSSGPAVINVIATDATGGTGPYTYQWQRNADGGSYSNLSGKTSLTCADTTVSLGVLYGYKLVYTDSAAGTVTSNAVTAQAYSGGGLTGGGSSLFSSSVFAP